MLSTNVPRGVRAAALALLSLLSACAGDALLGPAQSGGGKRPPYLAVVVFVDAPPGVNERGPYNFRVRELSGQLAVDTSFRASPKDTIIFHVEPATYRVDVTDVPATCGVRDDAAKYIIVPPNSNTALVRFFITCSPALVVAAYTDGPKPDPDYVLTIRGADGKETASVIPANDTVRFEGIAAGTYSLTLRHVSSNCVITSDGGEEISVKITANGGAFVAFRIICSDETRRPRIVQLAASYSGSAIGYVVRAVDPDKDIERTFVDITDCHRKTVLPQGGNRRGGFSGFPNVTRQDTAVIIGAYDLPIAEAALRGRCIAVWVADERGNTSAFVEQPIGARDAAKSPTAVSFNARLNGTRSLQVQLAPADPNQDYLGVFLVYLLRDGIVSFPADGQPDRLVPAPPGIIGSTIDELPLGIGYGVWSDYLTVVVFLIDRAGNVTRLEDTDLFR